MKILTMQYSNTDFVPRNACEDVPADTIARWYKKAPNVTFEDLCGMADLKAQLCQETAQILHSGDSASHEARSYFFYGLPGTGKTLAIRAFVRELMDAGYCFLSLHGGDIHSSLVGVAEKTVEIAFREALDNEPCVLVIDDIESVCLDRGAHGGMWAATRLTAAFLESCSSLLNSGKRVVLLTASNMPHMVDEAFWKHSKSVRFPLPGNVDRADFFARRLALPLEEDFTYADMAADTDNYSYRELVRIAEGIEFQLRSALIENHKICDENGSFDPEASVLAAEQALAEGRICLTRAMFQECLCSHAPYDKTASSQQLKAFEERAMVL